MNKLLPFLLLTIIIASGCQTTVFNNVEKKIQNTWILMPVEDDHVIEWQFTKDKISISINGNPVGFENTNGNIVYEIAYSVSRGVDYHYVHVEPLPSEDPHNRRLLPSYIDKYIVTTARNKELLLVSKNEIDSQVGEFQFHFYRE